jgi:uncharacterized protein (TIGR02246 family)
MEAIMNRAVLARGCRLVAAIGLWWAYVGVWSPACAQAKRAGEDRAADRAAIEKSSAEFARAFAKGDAKAIAALWTEDGEYHDEGGTSLRGRAAIEQAFREHFKEKTGAAVEVLIESIRFPARDLAIEEGLVRQTSPGKELPATTRYSVLHAREGGQWKIAVAREWGADQDRLEDLAWLIGTWHVKLQDNDVSLTFTREKDKPFISGRFTKKAKGKTVAGGTMKIALDPQTGRLRSWHFDDDGGYGHAHWLRDGNRWVLDAAGVGADGTDTASVNILGRVSHDAITWRSIDRVAGERHLPDTTPIKLTRTTGSD